MLIMGIKDLGKKVGCTGEGTTDIECLLEADIGIAMGSGVSAARLESDLVLLDDNFAATIDAIKWGRNIFINVSRFLQF
jgi:P-type E1-E2 ATPase